MGVILARTIGVVVISVWLAVTAIRAEIIDRILAVVGGEIILLTDAKAGVSFGVIEPAPGVPDPVRGALNALIDRQLQLFEVNRYVPPEPQASAVDARLDEARKRFPTPEAFQIALTEAGISEVQLRSRFRDNLRIESYRAQRFGAALQPSDGDLLRYYRSHEAEFTKDGVLQPFSDVLEEVRVRLVRERSTTLIREWIETLRRRTDVQILYGNSEF